MRLRAIIFGTGKDEIEKTVREAGFQIVAKNSDFVISYGGDGTLMRAEHAFPGAPKIVLKGSAICKKCAPLPNEEILRRVADGKYEVEEMMKIEVLPIVGGERGNALLAINDAIIHNKNPRHAIRYYLLVDEKTMGGEIIGDGVVISSPFGSTAYYRSITDSFFETGIGVAFNNSTEQSDHIVLKEDRVICVRIVRGPALVYADNQEDFVELKEGDEVIVKKSDKTAKIVRV